MQINILIQSLEENAGHVRQLLQNTSAEQARWKPDAETWSLLEIVNHLYDEEREDFRAVLDHLLHHPEAPWPDVDPMEWVTSRRYNERELTSSLDNFLRERARSLDWLRTLTAPRWEREVNAPWDKPIRPGDVAASWPAHDLWHIQQIVQLRRAYVVRQLAPYDVRYAGTL
ncbi:MAG: DUF664 domain-containing protein [Chloroflexi bacterium]|jgi:hypothetical protein|nr:DUF664 domain-containing protein [Chloroflexota bacterium]